MPTPPSTRPDGGPLAVPDDGSVDVTGGDRATVDDAGSGSLDVVAVGSALVDVLVHATDDLVTSLGLAKGSMALVDLERAARIYAAMPPGVEVSGGSAANTAAGVAALGGRVGFIGKVAADELGDVFVHDIAACGVTGGVTRIDPASGEDLATGRCLVLVTPDGERTMATHLGVASTLTGADLAEAMIAGAALVYLEGYLWDLEPTKDALRRAMAIAHDGDGTVTLSLSDPFCVERHRRQFLDLLQGDLDVVCCNEDEATLLFGKGGLDAAVESFAEAGVLAAVTRGAKGSVVVAPEGVEEVPASPVDAVVDTTGAGDLFAAGFCYGLTHGLGPVPAARLGHLCAAEVIAHIGARPQRDLRPYRDEVFGA